MNHSQSRSVHQSVVRWSAALLFVVAWYAILQTTMHLVFGVSPAPEAYGRDLAAHLSIGALLLLMADSLPRFMLATAAVFTTLTLGNALKLSILGGPLMPDDFVSAKNMFLLLDGWYLVGAVAMLMLPLLLLGWMIAWTRPRAWGALLGVGMAIGLLNAFPASVSKALDTTLGNSVWNQPANFQARGLPLHLLQEGARNLSRREPAPSQAEVADALQAIDGLAPRPLLKVTGTGRPQRNLHMIVLESFWDPTGLTAAKLSADPLAPELRELWAAAGHSHGLAPVFGGYTANTEFEVLCGFPLTQDNVFFEHALVRDVPCLPRQLANAGYRTIASHPNSAAFWNRVNAYRRIGFETYWSDGDFALDDMNGTFLSDASLYRQVLERLSPALERGEEPLFNYVLTYFGHLPYPLNDQRPRVIHAAPGQETVEAYANTLYYKSRELMDFLQALRRLDPEGLIVVFGDHPPFLGPNFGGFTESGLLASSRSDFSDPMFRTLVATPLVIIDGQHGVLDVGDLPFYQLPGLLQRLLGDERSSILAMTRQNADLPPIRPLPGMHFLAAQDRVEACRDDEGESADCARSRRWLEAIELLKRDIFSGEQHVLHQMAPTTTDFRQAALDRVDPALIPLLEQ